MRSGVKLISALAVAAGMLMGCAHPQYEEVAAQYEGLPPNNGRIYFYQPEQPGNVTSNHPYLDINGWKAGRSTPGHFFFVNRPAGTYTISTLTDKKNTVKFTLAAGQTRYVRVSIEGATGNAAGFGEQVMRQEESETKAKEELATLTYSGAGSRERKSLARTYPLH